MPYPPGIIEGRKEEGPILPAFSMSTGSSSGLPKWVEGVLMNVLGQICINLGKTSKASGRISCVLSGITVADSL
jgi:hypothetical protein